MNIWRWRLYQRTIDFQKRSLHGVGLPFSEIVPKISRNSFIYCRLPQSQISNVIPVWKYVDIWTYEDNRAYLMRIPTIFRLEKSQRFVNEIIFFGNGKNGKVRIFKGNYNIFWKFTFSKWKYVTLYWPLLMALAMDMTFLTLIESGNTRSKLLTHLCFLINCNY